MSKPKLQIPEISPRLPYYADEPHGALESLNDWYGHNQEAVEWFLENRDRLVALLDEKDQLLKATLASAEAAEATCSEIAERCEEKQQENDELKDQITPLTERIAELEGDAQWVRRRLGKDDDLTFLELCGELHVLTSHAAGYNKYITSYKCDDKQGEIARQHVKILEHEAREATLAAEVAALLEALEALEALDHGKNCVMLKVYNTPPEPCDCGLEKALRRAAASGTGRWTRMD